ESGYRRRNEQNGDQRFQQPFDQLANDTAGGTSVTVLRPNRRRRSSASSCVSPAGLLPNRANNTSRGAIQNGAAEPVAISMCCPEKPQDSDPVGHETLFRS